MYCIKQVELFFAAFVSLPDISFTSFHMLYFVCIITVSSLSKCTAMQGRIE